MRKQLTPSVAADRGNGELDSGVQIIGGCAGDERVHKIGSGGENARGISISLECE